MVLNSRRIDETAEFEGIDGNEIERVFTEHRLLADLASLNGIERYTVNLARI